MSDVIFRPGHEIEEITEAALPGPNLESQVPSLPCLDTATDLAAAGESNVSSCEFFSCSTAHSSRKVILNRYLLQMKHEACSEPQIVLHTGDGVWELRSHPMRLYRAKCQTAFEVDIHTSADL